MPLNNPGQSAFLRFGRTTLTRVLVLMPGLQAHSMLYIGAISADEFAKFLHHLVGSFLIYQEVEMADRCHHCEYASF